MLDGKVRVVVDRIHGVLVFKHEPRIDYWVKNILTNGFELLTYDASNFDDMDRLYAKQTIEYKRYVSERGKTRYENGIH